MKWRYLIMKYVKHTWTLVKKCLPFPDRHLLHAKSTVFCMVSKLAPPHWSTFLTRSTTGTDVHGIIPSSVMTISTKSGGVTSYTRLSRPSDATSCQCSSCLVPARVTMRSSGSSENDGWKWIPQDFGLDRRKALVIFFIPSSFDTKESVCTLSQNL